MKGELNENLINQPSNSQSLPKLQETSKTLPVQTIQFPSSELDPIAEIKKSLAIIQHGRTNEFTNKVLCKHEFLGCEKLTSVCLPQIQNTYFQQEMTS